MFSPYTDLFIFISTIVSVITGFFYRKQTRLMQKEFSISQSRFKDEKSITDKLQSRINDEIVGYEASPGVLGKMGLSERVELLSEKAIELDKKTDLQNVIINDMATTVKQLLPNGGNSIADKIDNLTKSISNLSVQLTDQGDKFSTHLVSSEITRREFTNRVAHIENQIYHQGGNKLEMPNGFSES